MKRIIKQCFLDSINTKKLVLENLIDEIEKSAGIIINALKDGNKILVCGNGGSSCDSSHFAGELVVKFEKQRKGLCAISLNSDTNIMTACSNDFGYELIFQRQIEAIGNRGDVLIGITTSGNSKNIINAFEAAKKKNMKIICLNGKNGGILKNYKMDSNLIIPGDNTARIQESHITIIHTWCRLIDEEFD